jgi:hypothetical protein
MKYSPSKTDIERILNTDRFEKIYFTTKTENPGSSKFGWAFYSFMQYNGWTGGFFGYGKTPFESRYTAAAKLSIPEQNALNYAANLAAGQPQFHTPQAIGPDLYTQVIPGYAAAAKGGALEGLEDVKKALGVVATLAAVGLTIYAVKTTAQTLNTVKV